MTARKTPPAPPCAQSRSSAADGRRSSEATSRNREPLLEALRRILPSKGLVLEIGSGTGEHAVFLGARLPDLVFQPSDPDPLSRESISAWIASSGANNVLPPLELRSETAHADDLGDRRADVRAVMAVNVIHISPWTCCLGLLRLAAELLPDGAPLALYGPFRRGGRHTAASNQAFDEMLRARDPAWGVRDLDEVATAAVEQGFSRPECIEMPANNLVVSFRKLP